MFCTNCGREIPDGSSRCYCGQIFDINSQPVTQAAAPSGMTAPTQSAAPTGINQQPVMSGSILGTSQRINSMNGNAANAGFQQPQQSYIPKEPVKNQKNTGLIVTLCIVVALLVGIIAFLAYYLNRPIYKIEQAMEKENIEKVVDLYPKLTKDEDQDYVQDQMFEYASSLKSQFVNGEVEYEEINQTLTDLGDVILGEYPGYSDLKQSVEDLKDSRDAFVDAENAFQLEDYETALAQYEMVIPEDSNYEAAQDGIEKVKEFLVPDIVGTWSTEIDLGSYLTGQMGYGSDLNFTMELVYDFGEDGIATCYIDEDSIYANKQVFTDYLMDMLYEYYEMSLGMDRDEIDSYLSAYYGMTMADMLEEELDVDELLQEMANEMQTEEFEYRIEADAFVIEKDNEEVHMYIEMPDQDTLLLTGTDNPNMNDSTLELLSQIGMDFPMTFKRK